ncbi:MAG: hypothetical protein LBE76_08820, partial [Nitrososphaerota archaeon]|nr:hypothetical protein [Nitrososphaerota archaeon]
LKWGWGNSWNLIYHSIRETTNQEIEKKYKHLDEKISSLMNAQKPNIVTNKLFHPIVENKTKVNFSEYEMNLLNKGLKYNLGHKPKTG